MANTFRFRFPPFSTPHLCASLTFVLTTGASREQLGFGARANVAPPRQRPKQRKGPQPALAVQLRAVETRPRRVCAGRAVPKPRHGSCFALPL
jgi:hypothetical protein